jgi:protein-L-isoaspartate(D-aspartate) O-methyltransferase
MCGFMPLRGIGADPQRIVALTPDRAVTLQIHQEQTIDEQALHGIFELPSSEAWTGVRLGDNESAEWMWLWLTCTIENALSRMSVERSAVDRDLVRPMFGWGTMATTADQGALAYLTLRKTGTAENPGGATQPYEIGVIGHGPGGGDDLVIRVADEIRTWNRDFRQCQVQFAIQPAGALEPIEGQFVFDMPLNRLVVSWQ